MRLLVFSPHYPPYVGGLETHAAEFNKYLAKTRDVEQITVYTSQIPSHLPLQEKVGRKITIIRFPAIHLIPNFPFPKLWSYSFWRQWRMVGKLPVDIVISRTRFTFTALMALYYAKRRRLAWVHIEHGSDYVQLSSRLFSWLSYWYDQTIGRLVLRSSRQNIAISEAVQGFVKKFDTRAMPVIYRGVETELIESIKPSLELRKRFPGKKIVIFVGRLIDGKGVADLVHAIKNLNNSKVVCVVVGDGSQRANLEALVESLGLRDQVIFYGQLPLTEAIGLVKAADIFVNPSYTEGLPSSVIEAALCKRCIVATDVGGTPEIIEHNVSGILLEPRNIPELTRSLRWCIDHSRLSQKMGHMAYRQAKVRFSWKRSCGMYRDVFREILQTPQSSERR